LDSLLEYGLFAVFVALILPPFGLPLPEDVSLLAAGVLVRSGHAQFWVACLVGYSGILCADTIAWLMGRKVGLHPTGFIARLVGPKDIERIERFFRRYGAWAIVIARQFPGLRFPAFFFAGASGVRYRRFIAFDGSAALITVGVFVSLGNAFGDDLGRIIVWLDHARLAGTVLVVIAVVFGIWRIIRWRGRHKKGGTS